MQFHRQTEHFQAALTGQRQHRFQIHIQVGHIILVATESQVEPHGAIVAGQTGA